MITSDNSVYTTLEGSKDFSEWTKITSDFLEAVSHRRFLSKYKRKVDNS